MKKQYFVIFCLFLATLLFSCSDSKNRTLHVYHWDDYISPDLVAKFEKQFKCKVEIDIFSSLEELNDNIVKGEKAYDVIFPSGFTAREMYENRLLKDIDHSKIPNLKNIDSKVIMTSTDSTMKYSIPYMTSYTGIAYNKNKIKDFKPAWSSFSRPDLAGKIGLLNDEREVIGAASKTLGYSYNGSDEIQLRKALNIIQGWKRNGLAFGDNIELEQGLISGKYDMIQDYSGNAVVLIQEHPEIEFVLPEEGMGINLDSFAIPLTSANTELAYAFINFFLDPEIAKDNMLFVSFPSPNVEAMKLLPRDFLEQQAISPPANILTKSEYIAPLGSDAEKYKALWKRIMPSE